MFTWKLNRWLVSYLERWEQRCYVGKCEYLCLKSLKEQYPQRKKNNFFCLCGERGQPITLTAKMVWLHYFVDKVIHRPTLWIGTTWTEFKARRTVSKLIFFLQKRLEIWKRDEKYSTSWIFQPYVKKKTKLITDKIIWCTNNIDLVNEIRKRNTCNFCFSFQREILSKENKQTFCSFR